MNQSGAIENSKFIRLNFFSTRVGARQPARDSSELRRFIVRKSQANRFAYVIQTLKRPEGRARRHHPKPGNLARRVAVEYAHPFRMALA